MLNNYEDTSSGFTNSHVQTPASIPRSVETQKQQNIGPTWSYNSQLEGLYSCYQNEHQPVYNIHSMGHFEGNGKHNNNPYPQYSTGTIHQPVPTPIAKCHEACCQHLSERYPINPAPLRYPPNGSVQPPRYGEISSNDHRQYFTERRPMQSSISRKKEFQSENGYSSGSHDRHFQYVGRGQIHVPESRQSMQMIRSQYPMYPLNSYWSPRNWSGPRMNYPPPPPYHQSVTNQTNQLQSNLKMTEPPHYIDPKVSTSLSSQQRRAIMRNANANPEIVRPIPETKRPPGNGSHVQGCYDFPYHSGFLPFNEVNKMSSNGISSQVNSSSCKVPIEKQYQQHHSQFTLSNNERAVPGCNNPLGDIAYPYAHGEPYMRNSVNGLQQMTDSRKLSLQYEQQSLGKKRPELDVRQFLATWDDDEEDSTRMSEPLHNNNNLAPYIVVDCRSLEGEAAAKLQERLKSSSIQNCQSKPQNESPGSLNNIEPKGTGSDDIGLRNTDPQRSLIHSEYPSQNNYNTSITTDSEKNLSFWNPENRENATENDNMMGKGAFQPLDCTKRDNMNVVEPIVTSKRDSHLHGDMNHKLMNNDPSHMSFDALVTYYGDSRRVSDGSYDLVEMTERLVNASDKICTIERNTLEQDIPGEGLHPCDPRIQNQIGANQTTFHHRLPPRYPSNNYQHYKSGINNDTFFNFKYPVGSSKFFGFDSSNLDSANFDYHKAPSEFAHQKSFIPKDKIAENFHSNGLSKNLDKIDLQDVERRGVMGPEVLKKQHLLNNYQIPEKSNLDFVGVDPEQFITPIIIKKSDYYNKENYSELKSSKNEVMGHVTNKTNFNEGNEKTVLMHSSNVETDIFKMSHSSNDRQVFHENNVVTLHSGDQTESNTVTVEVPYDEQYSSLVKLSEEITGSSRTDSTKMQENNNSKESKLVKSKFDSKEKCEQTVLKKPTSFKLKRLPNSKEWIKIGGDVSLELRNAESKSASEIEKNSTNSDIPKSTTVNLNMPSLDDIRFNDEPGNKNENNSSLSNIENKNNEEVPDFSKLSNNESKNSSYKSDNAQLTQLAIVPPMKFPTKNEDESMKTQSLADDLTVNQSKNNFDSNEKNFLTSDSQLSNHSKELEINSQFNDMHSPYGNLMSSEHSHSPFVDLSSKLQNTSDPHTNEQSSANTVIDTFISESTNLEHNYSDIKKMQSVGFTSTNQCLDMNSEEMLCGGNTEHGGTKESFSPFHNYSDCDMNSHMSAYFKLNNRICNSDKDMETCIPSSPGVEEMFEDINHTNNNENTFLEKPEEIEFLSRRDSPIIKSPCCRTETFGSNTFNLHDSVDLQDSSEITLNTTNSCNSLNFNEDKNDEIFSKSVQLNNNTKTEDNADSVKTLPAIPPINLKLNEQKKIWCIAKKPKDLEKSAENEIIKTKESYIFDEMKLKQDQECSHSPSNPECDHAKNIPQNSNNYFESSPTCESVTDTNVDLGCLPEVTDEENKNNNVSNLESEESTVQNVDENINIVTNEKEVKPIPVCSISEDSETHDISINNDSFLPSELSVESNSDFHGFAEVVQKDNENFSLGEEPLSKENEIKLFGSSTDIMGKKGFEIKQFSENESIFPDLNKKSATLSGDSNVSESELLTSKVPDNNSDDVDIIHQKNKDPAGKSQEDFPSMPDRDGKMKDDDSLTKPMNYLRESYTNVESGIEISCNHNCNNSDTIIHFSEEENVSFTTPGVVTTNDVEENFSSDLSSLVEKKDSLQDYHLQPEIVTSNGVTATDTFNSSENQQISVDDKCGNTKIVEADNLTYQDNENSCVGKIDYQSTIESDKNIGKSLDLNEINSKNENSTTVQGSDFEFPIEYKNEVGDIQNNVTQTNYSILSDEISLSDKICKNFNFEKNETRCPVDYEMSSNKIDQTDVDMEIVETCENVQKTIDCQKDYSKFDSPTLEENNIVNSSADISDELIPDKLKNDTNKTFDDAIQEQESCIKFTNDLVKKEKNLETNIKKTEKSSLNQCNNQENNIEVNSCLILEPVLDDKFENSNTDYKHIAEIESVDKLNKNYTPARVSFNDSDLIKNVEQKDCLVSNENFDTNESSRLVTEISEKNKLLINVIQEEDCLKATGDLVERERNEINQKIEFLDGISSEKSCLQKSVTHQNLEICHEFDSTSVDKILHCSKNNEKINKIAEYECSTESTEFNNSMDKLNENSQSLVIFNNSDEEHNENTPSTAKIYENLDTKDVIETPSVVEIVKGKTTLLIDVNKEYKQDDSISNILHDSSPTHDQEKTQSILVLTDPLAVLNNEDILGDTEGEINIVQTSNLNTVSKDNTEDESEEMSVKENFVEDVNKDVESQSSLIKEHNFYKDDHEVVESEILNEHNFCKHVDEGIEGEIISGKENSDEDNIKEVENETSPIKEHNLYRSDNDLIGSDTSVKEHNFDKDNERVEEEIISVKEYCDGDVNKGVDSETLLIKEHSLGIDYHEGFESVTTSIKVNICSQYENKEGENETLIDVNSSKNSCSNKTFVTKKDDVEEENDFIKDQHCSIETAVFHSDEKLHLAKDFREQKEVVEMTELVVKNHYLNNDQKINSSTLTVGICNHKDNEINITTVKRTTEIIYDNENCEKITSDATVIAESVNDTSNMMKLEDSVKVCIEHADICDRYDITSVDESPINLTTNINNTLTREIIDEVRQCYEGTEIEYSSEELNFGINYETGTSNKTNCFNSLTTANAFLDTDLKSDSCMKIQTINNELSDDKVSTEQTKIKNCELFVEKVIICDEIKSDDFEDSAAAVTNTQDKELSDHIDKDDTANLKDCFKHEVIINEIREIESDENRRENIKVNLKSEKSKILIDESNDTDNDTNVSEIHTKIKETVYPINSKRKFTDLENDYVLKNKKTDQFCTKSDANILGSKNSKNNSFDVSSEDQVKIIQNMDINLSTEESVISKPLNFVCTQNDIRKINKNDSIWQENENLVSSEEVSSKPFDKNNTVVFQESVKNNYDENEELIKKNEITKLNDCNNEIGFENDASHLNCVSDKYDSFKEMNKINDLKEEYNLRKSNLDESNSKFEANLEERNQDCEVNLTQRQNQNDHVTDMCRGLNCNQERVSDDFEFNGIRSNSSGECKELQFNIISDFDSKNAKCEAGITELKKPLKKKIIKNRSGKCNLKQRKYVPSSTSLSKNKTKNTMCYKSFKNKECKYDTVSENVDEFVRHPDTLLFKIEKRENEICDPKGGKIKHHSQHDVHVNINENMTETNCNESFVSSPLENAISNTNLNTNVCIYDLRTKIIEEQCLLEEKDDGLGVSNNHSNTPILKLNFDKDNKKAVNKHVDAEFSDEETFKHSLNVNCCNEMIEKEQINDNIQTSYSINASDTTTIIECNFSSALKSNTSDSPSEETVEKQMEAMHSSEFTHTDGINTQSYLTSSLVSLKSNVICNNLVNDVSSFENEEGKEVNKSVIEDANLIQTSQNEIKTKSTVSNYNLKELSPTPSLTVDPIIPPYKKHFPSNNQGPFVLITLDSDDNSCPTTDTLINYKVQLNTTDLEQTNLHLSDFLDITTKHDKECNTVVSNVSNLLTTTKHDKECNTDLSNESIMMDTTPFQCLVEAALAVETADANKMAIENSSRSCNEGSNSNIVSVIVDKEIHSNNQSSEDCKVNSQDNSRKEECSEVFPLNLHYKSGNRTSFKNISKPEKIDMGVVNVKKSKTKFRFPKPKYKLNAKAKQMKNNFIKSDLKLNTKDSSKKLKYLEKDILLDQDNGSEDLLASSAEQKPEIIFEKSNEDIVNPITLDNSLGIKNVSEKAHSHEIAKKVKCNKSEEDRLYLHVNSEKLGEYVSELNLGDIKIMTETEINEDVCLENETSVKNNLKLPNVELETGTNLVIIIEELDTGERTGELFGEEINIQNIVTSCDNLEGNVNEGDKETPVEIIVAPTSSEQSTIVDNSLAISELQTTDNNTFEVSNQTGYDDLNTNLSNDIANWPYVEEEVTHLDSLEADKDVIETNHLISSIKCSLPWERIFNIGNSKKRKVKRNKQMYPSNGLELGPAKIELRLASELGAWKVVNKNNDCVSPIVNVKRLILQRDPELASYSEKESEEEIDLKERRKSLSQSSDDSLPKVVIKKKNQTEYSSFIRIVDDIDDKKWQPVVALVRNKELDELCLKIGMESNKQKSNNNISPNCKSNASNQNLNKVKKNITKTRKRSISKKDKLTENEDVQKSPEHEIGEEELFPHNTDREDDFSFTDCIDPAQEYVWRCLDNEEDWMDRSPLQNYSDQRSGKDSFDEDELAFSSNERRHSFNGNYSYINENHPKRMPENGDIVETDYEDDKSKDWKHLQDSESTCSRKESVIDVRKNDFLQNLSFIFSKHRNRGVKRPSEGHSKEDTKRRRRQRIEKYPFHCRKCCIGFKTKEEMVRHKDSRHAPHHELHHCLLCQRSFSSSLRHNLHVEGRSHRHLELVQRHTMHTVHQLLTGVDFPRIRPLSHSERLVLDWRPNQPGCIHYYHQLTPLQIALQDYSTRQESSEAQLEINKKT